MNFEFLVEDKSGEKMLKLLVPRLSGFERFSYRIHSYKGLGVIPKDLRTTRDASKRILLEQLPKLLKGYGKTYQYDQNENVVIVVCDLDNKDKDEFLAELHSVLDNCCPAPHAEFCLAIEEMEAWYLGDIAAIKAAFPRADNTVLRRYVNDSICDTWELLADAIFHGGSNALKKMGYIEVGKQKSLWAERITPLLSIESNKSPSFNSFVNTIYKYID